MRYIFPLKGMKRFSEATGDGELAELQRFAKRFLRLVVLVAVAFVKLVRALAKYIRTHRHAFAAVLACPILGSAAIAHLLRRCAALRPRQARSLPRGSQSPTVAVC